MSAIVRSSPAPSVLREILLAVPLPSTEKPSESIVVETTSADPICMDPAPVGSRTRLPVPLGAIVRLSSETKITILNLY